MSEDSFWMYNRHLLNGYVNEEYLYGLVKFREAVNAHALSKGLVGMIRCPCKRCKNDKVFDISQIEQHLISNSFVEGYYTWEYHGEDYYIPRHVYDEGARPSSSNVGYEGNQYMNLVEDGPFLPAEHWFRMQRNAFVRGRTCLTVHQERVNGTEMETIFRPAFFDVMEHLTIHLSYEALNGGRMQYRWMYPFES
ncbi:hypothetical protein LIER_23013 [Lithospermum erythrorhizon]|uniref:Transposase-associated domain-containing protein n=1 Tax=Lithospermum erythrorhizon TaxID=34254 RepID=A0AAV3QYG9_LITER